MILGNARDRATGVIFRKVDLGMISKSYTNMPICDSRRSFYVINDVNQGRRPQQSVNLTYTTLLAGQLLLVDQPRDEGNKIDRQLVIVAIGHSHNGILTYIGGTQFDLLSFVPAKHFDLITQVWRLVGMWII